MPEYIIVDTVTQSAVRWFQTRGAASIEASRMNIGCGYVRYMLIRLPHTGAR